MYLTTPTYEHIHTLHDEILLWVIRMLLTGDLQNGWNRLVVILQNVTHIVGHVLVDEDNTDVIPLSECFQRALHDLGLCVLFHG